MKSTPKHPTSGSRPAAAESKAESSASLSRSLRRRPHPSKPAAAQVSEVVGMQIDKEEVGRELTYSLSPSRRFFTSSGAAQLPAQAIVPDSKEHKGVKRSASVMRDAMDSPARPSGVVEAASAAGLATPRAQTAAPVMRAPATVAKRRRKIKVVQDGLSGATEYFVRPIEKQVLYDGELRFFRTSLTRVGGKVTDGAGKGMGDHVTAYSVFLEMIYALCSSPDIEELPHKIQELKNLIPGVAVDEAKFRTLDEVLKVNAAALASQVVISYTNPSPVNKEILRSLRVARATIIGDFVCDAISEMLPALNKSENIAFPKVAHDRTEGPRVRKAVEKLPAIRLVLRAKSAMENHTELCRELARLKADGETGITTSLAQAKVADASAEIERLANRLKNSENTLKKIGIIPLKSGTECQVVEAVINAWNKLGEVSQRAGAAGTRQLAHLTEISVSQRYARIIVPILADLFDFPYQTRSDRVGNLSEVTARHLAFSFLASGIDKFPEATRRIISDEFVSKFILPEALSSAPGKAKITDRSQGWIRHLDQFSQPWFEKSKSIESFKEEIQIIYKEMMPNRATPGTSPKILVHREPSTRPDPDMAL